MDEFESNTYTPNERRDILYRYMLENTNKDHAISKERILDFLGTRNIKISRNTLFEDFEFIEATYDVDIKYDKGKNGYYILSIPVFEEHELRLILDSLKAAPFIMPDKKAALITKLLHFTDKYSRKVLLDAINAKTYKQVSLSDLDVIYEAIREDCKIRFKYPIKRDEEGDYQDIIVSPYTILSDGKHYLLFAHQELMLEMESIQPDIEEIPLTLIELAGPSYTVKGEHIRLFLVDRMTNITLLHSERRFISDEAISLNVAIEAIESFETYAPDNLQQILWRFIVDKDDEEDK